MTETLEDSMVPVYTMEYSDGTTRSTEDLPRIEEGIETLAMMAREDPECEVTLSGWTT